MLEDRPCLVSRVISRSCKEEDNWSYMSYRLEIEVPKGKRPLESEEEKELRLSKLSKLSSDIEKLEMSHTSPDLNLAPVEQSDDHSVAVDLLDGDPQTHQIDRVEAPHESGDLNHDGDYLGLGSLVSSIGQVETAQASPDLSLALADQFDNQSLLESDFISQAELDLTSTDLTLTLPNQSNAQSDPEFDSDSDFLMPSAGNVEASVMAPDPSDLPLAATDQSNNQRHAGDHSDLDSLISHLGRDNSISCLIRCSRFYYGSLACLNRSFRSLIRSGELYRLRRLNGVIEHWIYFSCHLLEWEAFDPIASRWMHLPRMPANECFMCGDKESLAVGTELLVFGKEVTDHVIYRYSLLTNSWSSGMRMNAPRCLFGSASLGEKAILAGGCDSHGKILSSAELYNSETGTWEMLPTMNKPRKMCSAVFMDGKFYVIGGIGGRESKLLTCGEEFNLETRTWTEIPNMSPGRSGGAREAEMPPAAEAPPLVAVVNNELYAADYAERKVSKYDKGAKVWIAVGELPERLVSMNGWGLAFRACGDHLVVIGGPRALGEGSIEINSWVPSDGPMQWNLLARKQSGNFVFNCAVMGC